MLTGRARASVLLLALSACSLTPKYVPPSVPVAAAYKEAGPWVGGEPSGSSSDTWWNAFSDETLNALENRVAAGNMQIAAAAARYGQARALLRQARGDLYPDLSVGAVGSRERLSADRPLANGRAATYSVGELGASLSYELDLFGRVRSSVAAGRADAEAAAWDVSALRLALEAQLASAYFDLRGLDARISLLEQTSASYERALSLTRTRHAGGISSGIDVGRAEAQLGAARAELAAVRIARQRDEHALAVLVGSAPADFTVEPRPIGSIAPAVPAAVPSTLLRSRPDIVVAERRVAAANARIGIARSALFPSVTLGASGGVQAARGALFSTPATFWALGPLQALLSVFDGGRRRAEVARSRAEFDEAAADYREIVLVAFREVEDDLAAQRLLVEQEAQQRAASDAAARTRDLAETRYKDGATDYLEVVTAQTAALDAQRALLDVRTTQQRTAVDLFRALGGKRSAS